MKIHLGKKLAACLAVLIVASCGVNASAQSPDSLHFEDFTTNQMVGFLFGGFTPDNTTFGPDGITTDIAVSAVEPSNFGGIGVFPVGGPIDITGTTSLEVTGQLLSNNVDNVIISIREAANADGTGDGEFFSFTIPASSFTTTGFTTVSIDPTSGFNGDFTNPGANMVLDGILNNSGVQNTFGGNDPQNVTIQSIDFVGPAGPAVPEPGSLVALLSLGTVAAFRRRRA